MFADQRTFSIRQQQGLTLTERNMVEATGAAEVSHAPARKPTQAPARGQGWLSPLPGFAAKLEEAREQEGTLSHTNLRSLNKRHLRGAPWSTS
jgi:hypothetical protein